MCQLAWTYIPRTAQWGLLPTHLHPKRLSHSGERNSGRCPSSRAKIPTKFRWMDLPPSSGWTAGARDSSLLRHRPHRLWAPTSLLLNGYRGSFPRLRRMGPEVDHYLLVRKFRISGTITVSSLYAFTWCRREKFYLLSHVNTLSLVRTHLTSSYARRLRWSSG